MKTKDKIDQIENRIVINCLGRKRDIENIIKRENDSHTARIKRLVQREMELDELLRELVELEKRREV